MNTQDFLQTPVRKLFFHYLLPSIFGTMVTSIYVLADTIMIGKGIGTVAMAALNIALPVYNIFFGLGLLTGVGGSVLMSIARGKGEKQKADAYFTASLLLTLSLLAVCMVIYGRDRLDAGRHGGDDAVYHGLSAVHRLGYGSFLLFLLPPDFCAQ